METIIYVLVITNLIALIKYIVKFELELKEIEENLKILRQTDIDIKSRINKIEKQKEKAKILTNEEWKIYEKVKEKFLQE